MGRVGLIMENINKKKWLLLIVPVTILAFLFIYQIGLGDKSFIRIHDNLDANILHYGTFSGSIPVQNPTGKVEQFMNGEISYFNIINKLSVNNLIYSVFPLPYAYHINDFLVRLMGLISMFVLLSLFKNISIEFKVLFSSIWALLPIFSFFGVSILGMPIMLYLMYESFKGRPKVWFYILVFVFPLFSSFVLVGIFYGFVLFLSLAIRSIREKRIDLRFLGIFGVFVLTSFIVNADLILSLLKGGAMGHRLEFEIGKDSIITSIKNTFNFLVRGHYHVFLLYNIYLLVSVIYTFILIIQTRRKIVKFNFRPLLVLYSSILSICLFAGFYDSFLFADLKASLPILNSFQFDRLYFFVPLLSIIALFVTTNKMRELFKSKFLILAISAISFILPFAYSILQTSGLELRNTLYSLIDKSRDKTDTYSQAYGEYIYKDGFSKLENVLPKDKSSYKTFSLGLAPEITAFHGYSTLDGYVTSYPLEYKHKIEKVIEKELAKNPKPKKLGSRAYLFSSELKDFDSRTGKWPEIKNLELNLDALREITTNPVYLISIAKISNYTLFGQVTDDSVKNFERNLYVYKIQD